MSGSKRKQKHKNIIIKAYIGLIFMVLAMVVFINIAKVDTIGILVLHGLVLVFLFFASGVMVSPFYRAWRLKNGRQIQKERERTAPTLPQA